MLFLIDARAGVTPADRHFADWCARSGKPVILVANKAEGAGRQAAPARPSRSASASRCRFRPSTARVWPTSTRR